ncbi:hypothetical protein CBOM_05708 [Ceraceosorus bombacis]|uniref:Uncharacterized protein n=1 Tax=Ceraceosorus bombacis TaxID=401625 RepID=A0A0P1BR55_9BASI|nr:hypothetical protein CBOM_05708 [Ceraceosorus bombacis]
MSTCHLATSSRHAPLGSRRGYHFAGFFAITFALLLLHDPSSSGRVQAAPLPPPDVLTVPWNKLDQTGYELLPHRADLANSGHHVGSLPEATYTTAVAKGSKVSEGSLHPIVPENPRLEDIPPGHHVAYHDSKGSLKFEWHPGKGFLRAHGKAVDPQTYRPLKHTLHDELDKLYMIVGNMNEAPAKRTRFVYDKSSVSWLPFSGNFPNVVKQSASKVKPKVDLPTVRTYQQAHEELQGLPVHGRQAASGALSPTFSGKPPLPRASSSNDLPPLASAASPSGKPKLPHTKSDPFSGAEVVKPPKPVLNRSHSEALLDHMDRSNAPVFPYRFDLMPTSPRLRDSRFARRTAASRLSNESKTTRHSDQPAL